jgi:hypothetical protein
MTVSHTMPEGISRVEKGIYRSTDGRWEIRQADKRWTLIQLNEDGEPLRYAKQDWATRGEVAALLPHPNIEGGAGWKSEDELSAAELLAIRPELHPGDDEVAPVSDEIEQTHVLNSQGDCAGSLDQTGIFSIPVACKVCGRMIKTRKNGVMNKHKPEAPKRGRAKK